MKFTLLVMFTLCYLDCRSQSVTVSIAMPPVALVDLLSSGSGNITLTAVAPTEAGNGIITTATNSNNWLIFTSAVATGISRSIRGDIAETLPAGLKLRLVVSPYIGIGQGFTGGSSYVTANVYLTNSPTSFIDNIKGAFTGTTYGTSGYKLTYSLEVDSYANIRSGSTTVTVRYTMTDN